MPKQRLVLVASAQPWRIVRAVLELGDIIYHADPDVRVVPDRKHPVIYVYSSMLSPGRVYRILTSEPPAYSERFVPAEIILQARGGDALAQVAQFAASRVGDGGIAWVEVHPRNYFLESTGASRGLTRRLVEALAELGVDVARRGATVWIVVEDTAEGVVAAVLPPRGDRASLWRKRRLGQIY